MAFNLLQAASTFRNPLSRGMFAAIASTNELISQITFKPQPGVSYDVTREGALASVEWVDVGSSPNVTESASAFDQAAFPFRQISSDVDLSNFVLGMTTPNGDPRAMQITQKLKALGMTLQAKSVTGSQISGFTLGGAAASAALTFVSAMGFDAKAGDGQWKYTNAGQLWQFRAPGDLDYGTAVAATTNGTYTFTSANASKKITVTIVTASATANGEGVIHWTTSTNEPDGLIKLCDPSQVIPSSGTNGDALSFDTLDQLILEKVKVRTNNYFLMNSKLLRKYRQLARTANLNETAISMMGDGGKVVDRMVPAYAGIPILQVDDIPSTESKGSGTTLSSVFLVSLDPNAGFFGAVQQAPNVTSESIDLDPFTARIGGVRLYDLGQRDGKAASGIRVEWIGGFGLGSKLALARASELVTA